MNKPSEKAMQIAAAHYGEPVNTKWAAVVVLAERLDAFNAESLEEQHRKTWALAMRLAVKCVNAGEVEFGYSDDYYKGCQRTTQDIAKALETLPCPPVDHTDPCPPIEATKDK